MRNRSVLPMRVAKYGYIVISLAFCVLGIILMAQPAAVVEILGVLIGIGMVMFGLIRIVGYFSKDLYRLAFQFDLEFGALFLILGMITLIKPEKTLNFIGCMVGIVVLVDCLFKYKVAKDARQFGIRDWWITCVLAILTGIAGLVLILQPAAAFQTLSIFLGLVILLEGMLGLMMAIRYVKIVNNQKPDYIDIDYVEVKE